MIFLKCHVLPRINSPVSVADAKITWWQQIRYPAIWLEQLKISADMKNSRQTILENHFFRVIYEPKAHSTLC